MPRILQRNFWFADTKRATRCAPPLLNAIMYDINIVVVSSGVTVYIKVEP